jgi:hypothetical protein
VERMAVLVWMRVARWVMRFGEAILTVFLLLFLQEGREGTGCLRVVLL